MTTNNNNSTNGSFNFNSKEEAIALYLDARRGREAILADLENHEEYMSRICKGIMETFGTKDDVTGKVSCQLDLGDGSPRGHIVVAREREGQDSLYFIRERNTGRPVGSKNKTTKAKEVAAVVAAGQAEQPEIVSEGEVVADASTVTTPSTPTLSPMEQALATAEQEERELAAAKTSDPVVDAILATQERTLQALREHSRSVAPATVAAGE